MSERDEFEAWAIGRFYLDHIGGESEQAAEYAFDTTDAAWQAWQAARATPPQAVPALTDEQILLGVAEFADENMLANHRPDILRCVRTLLAAAPQPSPEPKEPEHAHDWRFSLQDHVYKCDCGATRGDYPFGAASFKD